VVAVSGDLLAGTGQEPKRDRFGRYLLPDPASGRERAWTRVTTLAKSISDTHALTAWSNRMVAAGMAQRPDLVGLAAASPVADRKALNKIAEQAKEAAASSAGANSGTALHQATERADRGEQVILPAPFDADLAAYTHTMAAHRLGRRVEWIERIVVVPELGVAGMVDRILTGPTGLPRIGDLKTGKHLAYGWLEIAAQLALYSRASQMWNPGATAYEPMPRVDQKLGLVVHVPIGQARCDLYQVDLDLGWQAAQLCAQVRRWRARKDLARPYTPPLAIQVEAAATTGELVTIWQQAQAEGRWSDALTDAARRRKQQLTE
jgi:hypothetical protein